MKTKEGTRVATVGRDGARMANCGGSVTRPIWTGAIYEARARTDGVVTWRRVGSFGGTRSGNCPSSKFLAELRECAPEAWVKQGSVKHGQIAN